MKRVSKVDWSKNLDAVFGNKFKKILSGIIVKDVKDGLQRSVDVNNNKLTRLRVGTVRQKKKKKYSTPSKPLIATGTMKKLPPTKIVGNNAEIAVAKSRSSIAMYHNEGIGQKKREWFKVSDRAKEKMARAIGKKVVHILKRDYRLPNKL